MEAITKVHNHTMMLAISDRAAKYTSRYRIERLCSIPLFNLLLNANGKIKKPKQNHGKTGETL